MRHDTRSTSHQYRMEQRHIGDRAAHGPLGGHAEPVVEGSEAGDAPGRGSEPDNAAERRRVAQGAAKIGPVSEGEGPAGEGSCRATTGASGAPRGVPRVAGQAVDGVERVGTGTKLGGVGLADTHGPSLGQQVDDRVADHWHMVDEERAAVGGPDSGDVEEVLVGDDEASQWSVGRQPGIGVEGGGKRLGVFPVQCHEGIDDRLGGLGPLPTGNEQFAG